MHSWKAMDCFLAIPDFQQITQTVLIQESTTSLPEPHSGQSCNEDFYKILGKGYWYRIHDFIANFRVNDRPIYMALCSQ